MQEIPDDSVQQNNGLSEHEKHMLSFLYAYYNSSPYKNERRDLYDHKDWPFNIEDRVHDMPYVCYVHPPNELSVPDKIAFGEALKQDIIQRVRLAQQRSKDRLVVKVHNDTNYEAKRVNPPRVYQAQLNRDEHPLGTLLLSWTTLRKTVNTYRLYFEHVIGNQMQNQPNIARVLPSPQPAALQHAHPNPAVSPPFFQNGMPRHVINLADESSASDEDLRVEISRLSAANTILASTLSVKQSAIEDLDERVVAAKSELQKIKETIKAERQAQRQIELERLREDQARLAEHTANLDQQIQEREAELQSLNEELKQKRLKTDPPRGFFP